MSNYGDPMSSWAYDQKNGPKFANARKVAVSSAKTRVSALKGDDLVTHQIGLRSAINDLIELHSDNSDVQALLKLMQERLLLLLSGCSHFATKHEFVTVDRVHELKVPVSSPCMGLKPDEPVAMRDRYTRDYWNAIGTDQREAATGSAAIGRKLYGDQLSVAAAGCR